MRLRFKVPDEPRPKCESSVPVFTPFDVIQPVYEPFETLTGHVLFFRPFRPA
jgi:hypothetical protein